MKQWIGWRRDCSPKLSVVMTLCRLAMENTVALIFCPPNIGRCTSNLTLQYKANSPSTVIRTFWTFGLWT